MIYFPFYLFCHGSTCACRADPLSALLGFKFVRYITSVIPRVHKVPIYPSHEYASVLSSSGYYHGGSMTTQESIQVLSEQVAAMKAGHKDHAAKIEQLRKNIHLLLENVTELASSNMRAREERESPGVGGAAIAGAATARSTEYAEGIATAVVDGEIEVGRVGALQESFGLWELESYKLKDPVPKFDGTNFAGWERGVIHFLRGEKTINVYHR